MAHLEAPSTNTSAKHQHTCTLSGHSWPFQLYNNIYVIGKTLGHLYQSEFFKEMIRFNKGPPPPINLFNEKNNGLAILDLIKNRFVNAVHEKGQCGFSLEYLDHLIDKLGLQNKRKLIKNIASWPNTSKTSALRAETSKIFLVECISNIQIIRT